MPRRICKVLVVEDNEPLQELLETIFEDVGYRFRTVADGAAMRMALAEDPEIDVVVIDVGLPGGEDGFTLGREAAAAGHAVILSTGSHEHEDALETSGHRYILKPYRIAAFLALIEDVLEQARRKCARPEHKERVA